MGAKLLYLIPYLDDVPKKDSYIIYDMNGGKYYCPKSQYVLFANYFLNMNNTDHCLTMDLSSTPTHTLIFDIDVKYQEPYNTMKLHMEYIDTYCIPVLMSHFLCLKNFTVVIAVREHGGIHLHFPEILIAHDDYIRLCTQLQMQFQHDIRGSTFRLDILRNATLSNSMKPNTPKYTPERVMYFDEDKKYELDLYFEDYPRQFEQVKKAFKKRKDNSFSYFRKLLSIPFTSVPAKLKEYMMPVPVSEKPLHRLSYPTLIVKDEGNEEYEHVAEFLYKKKTTMYIFKGTKFQTNGIHWQRSYFFLKFNAFTITEFQSFNHALNTWHKWHCLPSMLTDDVFLNINQVLKEDNFDFANDPNPIRSILVYKNGYYFLPVFYALCRYLKMSSKTLIQHLRTILDNHEILDALDQIDSTLIDNLSRDFTLDTILFCGSNMIEKCSKMRDMIRNIVVSMRGILWSVSTSDQLVEHIRHIQERHLPIVVASLRFSCKKPVRYMWNCIHEYWQEVSNQTEIQNLINTIWATVLNFLKLNGPKSLKSILNEVHTQHLIASVCSETNVDRQLIEMDRHKWLLRTEHGVLDLLTGHVGGTVPEFYMSDRRLGIRFDRQLLMDIRQNRQDIVSTYRLLTQKSFFQSYLKQLFLDYSDDLLDTLREKLREENMYMSNNPLVESMYHIYVHLCKYTSFDYDKFMYLLDVTTSLLVATNYHRKFYIFKGETRNGKSKFFQMLTKVFGGYSHTIRSVNLQTGNTHALIAQPELASSLFNCRLVIAEELAGKLNENLVKEITGNSSTSFRNLYEQNTGGIPTAKIFASMNIVPICTATEAFKDRVVAFPFESEFTTEGKSLKTSEQVILNKYPLDTSDSVIESSYEGFFLLMYQHFIHNADFSVDGMIQNRKEPLSLVEFKTQFLLMTDMFVQFKQFADIQIVNGCTTTYNELKSAIRQYLKTTKNTSVNETDLIVRFDEEYGHLKKTDLQLDYFVTPPLDASLDFEPLEEEEEEEKKPKKMKKDEKENILLDNKAMSDLQILKKYNLPIDTMIQFVVKQNPSLRNYYEPSNALKGFRNVTVSLVDNWRNDAYAHIKHILDHKSEYGSLYTISQQPKLFNRMDVNYIDFPLVKDRCLVLQRIEEMAKNFYSKDSLQYKITCLYLLYFYALLVNPEWNWIVMDYINNGNRNHQYLVEI